MNQNKDKKNSNKKIGTDKIMKQIITTIISIVILCGAVISNITYKENDPEEISYNEFLELIEEKKVDTIYYSKDQEYMRFTLFNEETKEMTKEEREEYKYEKSDWRKCLYPNADDFREKMLLEDTNLVVKVFEPLWKTVLNGLVSSIMILWFVVMIYILNKSMNVIGSNKAILASEKDVKVRFDDVIGHDEIKKDLQFIVKMMSEPPSSKNKSGIKTNFPKGILFTGEPGTGKTLLAKAIAGEAGVPFLYMNASNFIEMYVGVGAKRVRELFAQAKKIAPCIIFIDEIDAIGQSRNRMNTSSEDTQTINALLQEMDGFDSDNRIFIIAATNNAESLDPALVRSGRFDRQIEISPPKDWTVRKQLLDYYFKDQAMDPSLDLDTIAKEIVGFTGADVAMIANEASLIAFSKGKDFISNDDIEEAIDKKILKGNRTTKKKENKSQEICAYHEAGHAIMCYLLHHDMFRISVVGTTSGVGGFVMHADDDTNCFKTKKDMEDELMIAYGGRCSEAIKFGKENITTGAISDIKQATNILSNYVSVFGFDNNLINYQQLAQTGYTDNKSIVSKMNEIAEKMEKQTMEMLSKNYELVERLAQALLKEETLSGPHIIEIIESNI